jgi:hypothetical protein
MPLTLTEQFGIFEDISGVREDIPCIKLSHAYSPESENVFLRYGKVRRMPGRLPDFLDSNGDKVPTPDGNPIIHYHRHFDSLNTEYVFAFTKAHIYRWLTDTLAFTSLFTCSSDCEMWESASFNGKVIATNWVDYIIYWDETTPGTDFAALDTTSGLDTDGGTTYVTKAKYLKVFDDRVIIGFTQEGGETYPYRIRWCSLRDESDWQSNGGSGDANYKDFLEGPDLLRGFGHYTAYNLNLLIVFKSLSYYPGWSVETEEIFSFPTRIKIGLMATHSVINDTDGKCYFMANDYTIREVREGVISQGIDKTLRKISPTYQHLIESTFIDEYNMLCWSVPGSAASTGLDKLIRYNLDKKIFEIDTFAVRAFGQYSRQTSYSIDTYPGTIDEATEIFDSVANITGFPIDLASDESGYTYDLHSSQLDCGSSYTSKLVLTTDLTRGQALKFFKRLWSIQLWLDRKESGSVTISIKKDTAANWLSLGTVDMSDSALPDVAIKDLPCDGRARHFLIKIESTVDFAFLGMIFDFNFDGAR